MEATTAFLNRLKVKIRTYSRVFIGTNESSQVIIVGAGLGGLGAALGFLRGGHRVVILESAPEIAEVRP